MTIEARLQDTIDVEKVLAWLKESDGYLIYDPQFFLDMGFPEKFVGRFDRNHGGGEGKYAVTGNPQGVSEFQIIDGIAHKLGVEACHMYYGRGMNYRTTKQNVIAALRSLT